MEMRSRKQSKGKWLNKTIDKLGKNKIKNEIIMQ
jgi:hypothetical protein